MSGEKETGGKPEQAQEFDIQHDDEFEDFKVRYEKVADKPRQGDVLDDWDDDVVENFAEVLRQQRSLIQSGRN
jgi:hypothetical protein